MRERKNDDGRERESDREYNYCVQKTRVNAGFRAHDVFNIDSVELDKKKTVD